MSTTLIAVVFVLALGHLAPGIAAAVRRHHVYGDWLRLLDSRLSNSGVWQSRYGIVLAWLPLLVVAALLQFALHSSMYGVAGLLFGVLALFYAWGPRDLDIDVARLVEATDADRRNEAATRLGVDPTSTTGDFAALVEAVFHSALRRWFGTLFWFLLLGATGAILYRLAALSAEGEYAETLPEATRAGARKLFALLNWPVAQLMTLSLMLVGNFDTVLGAWRDSGGASLKLDQSFLGAAARASVRSEIAEEAEELIEEGVAPGNAWAQLGELPELRDAMSLVWRILLLWVVILAAFVIAGWVS